MRRTGTKTASVNNLTVDTAGLQSLLSAGYPTAVEIGTAAGARITVGRRVLWNVSKIQKYLDEIQSERRLKKVKKPEYRKGYTNISNDLMDNICKLPLNGTDIKVILCIFRYTAGVGRKSCKLSGSSIAKWGNCDLRAVKRALKKLQENKIIIRVNPNIKGKAAEIMINKDYKQWSINKDIQE
mgnify:CR=1 FL=1